MVNDPAVFASHIQESMSPEAERVAKSYIEGGYFQVSRAKRLVARLPRGSSGKAAVLQAAKERHWGPSYTRVLSEMEEQQAALYYLKHFAPRVEMEVPIWLAFRRLGGKAYGETCAKVVERMADEARDAALELAKSDGWTQSSNESGKWLRLAHKVRFLPAVLSTNALARAYVVPVAGMPATHIAGQGRWATRVESAEPNPTSNRPRVTALARGHLTTYYKNLRREWVSASGAKLLVGIALES